jgi:putative ABC transport system permease protein
VGESLQIDLGDRQARVTVVGVVADVPPFQPNQPLAAEVYWPFFQETRWGAFVVVRAPGAPTALERTLSDRLRQVSPALDPGPLSTLSELVDQRLVSPRFNALLLSVFAVVALTLAAVGIGGLVAYEVSRRTREIGLRVALGARLPEIVRRFVVEGGTPVAAGVVAGTAGAMALSRFLGSMLAGTSPTDPVAFGAVVVGMLLVGLAAAVIPALRAGRVDPLTALRAD